MIFNRLTIKNITSIVEGEINFDQHPLAGEPYFLICGANGAGKTTILNAICLALFNRTPFYKGRRNDKDTGEMPPNDSRQMMRKGAKQASVELVFTGDDGRRYTARWSVAVARTGTVQNATRQLVVVDADGAEVATYTGVGDISDVIHRAIGLTYEQFARTVMLAQGQFTAFIKAEDNEKSDILEKLTGTEIYTEIARKITERRKAVTDSYNITKAEIDAYSLLADDVKAEYQASVVSLNDRITALAAEITTLDTRLAWLRRQRELAAEQQRMLQAKTRAQADVEAEENKARIKFVADWTATAEVRALQAERQRSEAALAGYNASLHRLGTDKWPRILNGVEWLARDLDRATANRAAYASQLEAASQAYTASVSETERIETELKACNQKEIIEEYDKLQVKADALNRAIAAISEYRRCRDDFAERRKAYADIVAERRSLAEQFADIEARLPGLSEAYKLCRSRFDGQKELRDHIVSLRRSFADTGQCPLCGSTGVHLCSDEAVDAKVAESQAAADEALAQLQQAQAQRGACVKSSATVDKSMAIAEHNLNLARQRLDTATKAVANIEDYDSDGCIDALRSQLDDLGRQQTAVGKRLQAVRKLRDSFDSASRTAQTRLKALHNAEKALDVHVGAIDAAKRLLEVCRSAAADLESRFGKSDHTPRPEKCDDIEAELRRLAADTSRLDGAIGAEKTKITSADEKIAQWLESHSYSEADVRRVAAVGDADVEQMRRQSQQLADTLTASTGRLDAIVQQIERHAVEAPALADDDTEESVSTALAAKTAEKDAATEQRAGVEALLANDEKNLQRSAEALKRLEKLKEEKERYDALYDVFGRADAFKKIAQSYVLRALLHKANYYLNMLTRRYVLDCADGSLQINVIDTDRDNSVRNIISLSGGESFVVSLSLALGLSSISRNRITIGTIFIDEGFDVLDEAALDTVITMLERLHSIGGRQIGIISHEPELFGRITAQVRLCPAGPGTSKIEVVST